MKQLFIPLFILAGSSLLAQTKEIAFKSHSGNMANFKVVLENELFGSEDANFGLPPDVRTFTLDSVIYISDSKTLLVRKQYSREYNEPKDSARFIQVRRDTVYNDPMFTRKHSLDNIRDKIKAGGKYINPVSETVFVGYDNKKAKDKKKNKDEIKEETKENTIPVVMVDNDNNNRSSTPFDNQLGIMLGVILFLSLTGGWVSWKLYQPRLQKL